MSARIRLPVNADAAAVAAVYAPIVEGTAISFETVAPSADEMADRMAQTLEVHPWLVWEIGGEVAGYAYATTHRPRSAYRWSVDTSVYISASHRRSGAGRGLYISLFAILAAQGYVNAFAGITLPNPASIGLHESLGFEPIGIYRKVGFKLGAWHDVGWWQVALRERGPSPREPLPLADVTASPEWTSMLARGESAVRGVEPGCES